MDKFVLGVDLDGVVAHFTQAFREHIACVRDLKPEDLPDPNEWDFNCPAWGISNSQDFMHYFVDAIKDGIYAKMQPMKSAPEVLQSLSSQGIHISIVTSRLICSGTYRQAISDTAEFLDAHKIPYRDILFLADKERYRFDLMVEDMPRNIERLQASKLTGDVLIFDQLYNRHIPGDRVRDWPEVRRVVQQKYAIWKTRTRANV